MKRPTEHVPPELIFDCPVADRAIHYDNIFETRIPEEHGKPPIYWCANIWVDGSGGWVIRKAEYLKEAFNADDLFSSNDLTGFASLMGESWQLVPSELDGAIHDEARRSLNAEFTPQKMFALNERVRERARTLIQRFADNGRCDFVAEFAVPFPVTIFLELFGLPADDFDLFTGWGASLQSPEMAVRNGATSAVKDYLMQKLAERRQAPRDDLISHVFAYRFNGAPWTDDMIFGYYFNMFLGGLDTVATNLGLQYHHLATHANHQATLRADPSRIPLAVEELLRAYSAITVYRTVTRDTDFHSVFMRAGDKVALSTMLAARDPEAWDAPNEVRLDRRPSHLAFGSGMHRCIGMHLARRELVIAMEELLSMLPPFTIEPGASIPIFASSITSIRQLPLVWGATAIAHREERP